MHAPGLRVRVTNCLVQPGRAGLAFVPGKGVFDLTGFVGFSGAHVGKNPQPAEAGFCGAGLNWHE